MSILNMKFVITGGAEGIGAATARIAAGQGAQVCIGDINESAEVVVEDIRNAGGKAWFIKCDVTEDAQLDGLMGEAAACMGGIDVLNNNAGVVDVALGTPDQVTLEHFDRKIWNKVIAINLSAPMFAAKAALPWLKQSANASIINAGSTASFVANVATLAYGSSKGGIAMLTKNLAVELAPFGIRCNAYCPGGIRTPMQERFLVNAPNRAELEEGYLRLNLMSRFGDAEEIAELVCFLASDKCRYVNGVTWLADGGMLAFR